MSEVIDITMSTGAVLKVPWPDDESAKLLLGTYPDERALLFITRAIRHVIYIEVDPGIGARAHFAGQHNDFAGQHNERIRRCILIVPPDRDTRLLYDNVRSRRSDVGIYQGLPGRGHYVRVGDALSGSYVRVPAWTHGAIAATALPELLDGWVTGRGTYIDTRFNVVLVIAGGVSAERALAGAERLLHRRQVFIFARVDRSTFGRLRTWLSTVEHRYMPVLRFDASDSPLCLFACETDKGELLAPLTWPRNGALPDFDDVPLWTFS